MQYICYYTSPLGELLLTADDVGLTGLCFVERRELEEKNGAAFADAKRWLGLYFAGQEPGFLPRLHLKGTAFQMEIWELLLTVPYGKTVTYGEIATIIAKNRGVERMSPQAVGGAVGRNPVSILVPCHRVVGSKGRLTGYAWGLDKKMGLLNLERNGSCGSL